MQINVGSVKINVGSVNVVAEQVTLLTRGSRQDMRLSGLPESKSY